MKKTTFALYFGNRGFFPGELIADARKTLIEACEKNGFGYLVMDEDRTRYGAVETIREGALFAQFLKDHEGDYDGIILSLPNFGDENGASEAFADVSVPILVQAFPDEPDRMDFQHRRDALCGKLAMCNVLRQLGIRYTLTTDFCVHPLSDSFASDLAKFAGTCRVVSGMRRFNVGAIGARTTAFKTVRYDEIAFAGHRINVETFDLARIFAGMDAVTGPRLEQKKDLYASLSDFGSYPPSKLDAVARLGVVVDDLVEEYGLHAVALRCWDEFQKKYGIAPCLVLCDLNERGIGAACELDVTNAVMMRAMGLAADWPVMLLDVNNNYKEDPDRIFLFHCGPAPKSLMRGPGTVEEHLMFRKAYGEGSGVGINKGLLFDGPVTVGSFKTENGRLCSFAAEGRLLDEPMPAGYFGCGAVYEMKCADRMLSYMASNGYRHHVAVTKGHCAESVKEAFLTYLDIDFDQLKY